MTRLARFTFLVNDNERREITFLAEQLQRKESDAVRVVVLKAARDLGSLLPPNTTPTQAALMIHRELERAGLLSADQSAQEPDQLPHRTTPHVRL